MTFVDIDQRIVQHFGGLTIAAIWQTHGEPAFRAAETQTLGNVLGAAQQNASNQLSNMHQTAIAQQGALEEAERQYRIQFMNAVASFMASSIGGLQSSSDNSQGMDSQSAEMSSLIPQLIEDPEVLAVFNAGAVV